MVFVPSVRQRIKLICFGQMTFAQCFLNLNKFIMKYGTSHFPSEQAAVRYYSAYETNPKQAVLTKLKEDSIKIGKPKAKPGQKVYLNQEEERYFISEGN